MTDRPQVTRFGIMRHGETEWNRSKRMQGQADSALTGSGRRAVRQWTDLLAAMGWDRLLVSDLGRARETAAMINARLNLPQHVDARLREQHWGHWTGCTIAELRRSDPTGLARMEARGWRFQPPGGETREAVWRRSHDALADAARRWPGETILVVAHGGVIRCLLYRLLERRFVPGEPPALLTRALHWLHHDGRTLAIEACNAVEFKTPASGH